MKKRVKKTIAWIARHEYKIWAVIFQILFLTDVYFALHVYLSETGNVAYYATSALMNLLISILYLRIDTDKSLEDYYNKIIDKQRDIIGTLFRKDLKK